MKHTTIFFLSFAIFSIAAPAFALPLVPCGNTVVNGVVADPCTPCHLFTLADRIIDFALKGLALPILVVALLAGGIVWMTASGNPSQIEKGRKILTSSIVGIFIAFGAWLLVDTIIVTLGAKNREFQVDKKTHVEWAWNSIGECREPIVAPPTTGGGIVVTPPAGTFQTEAEAQAFFQQAGIQIVSTGNCSDQQNKECTSLIGLPRSAAQALLLMKTGANFRISGGTEVGHAEHGLGKPVVDLQPVKTNPTKDDFVLLMNQSIAAGKTARCEATGGAVTDCGPGTSHVHAVFR